MPALSGSIEEGRRGDGDSPAGDAMGSVFLLWCAQLESMPNAKCTTKRALTGEARAAVGAEVCRGGGSENEKEQTRDCSALGQHPEGKQAM